MVLACNGREIRLICMSAESVAKVGGAAPKDRYGELVLIRSSVRCQGQDRGLAAAENQGDRRLGRGQIRAAVRHHQSPAPFHPGQVPVACLLARGQQARARACAAAARALAWSKKWPARGSLFADGVKIRSWVTIIQRLGCPASQPFRRDSRVLARQLVRSRAGGPGCEGRRSVVADGGGRKAGPEPLCMNAPGRRAIGCVAFQPAAGTITSVASWLRGGDPDERPGQMEPRR